MTRIVFADPGLTEASNPNLFKVELTEERSRQFLERIWNMEDWSTVFEVAFEATYTEGTPYNWIFSWALTGKYTQADVNYDAFADETKTLRGDVYFPAPRDRAAANALRTTRTTTLPDDTDPDTLAFARTIAPVVMPSASIYTYVGRPTGLDPQGLTIDIAEDDEAAAKGDAAFTLSPDGGTGAGTHESDLFAEVAVVWLKADGTATVYFVLGFLHDISSEIVITLGNTESDFTGVSPLAAFEDVDLDLCGQTVPARLWHYSTLGNFPSDIAINSFSFEYRVDDVTLYTYPVG